VRYPLTVFAGDVRIPIANAAAFIDSYDIFFTPALKAVIADAAAPARPPDALAVSAAFATIGADAVRIERVNDRLTITRITVPLGASAPPIAGDSGGRRAAAYDRSPQRLFLDVGQVQRAGGLAPGQRDRYLLSATKNQLLEVRITGVAGQAVVARITNARTGKPIDERARSGVRTWAGRVPEEGDYRIDVVRVETGREPRMSYLMTVVKQ
jgi:hypothetical protein